MSPGQRGKKKIVLSFNPKRLAFYLFLLQQLFCYIYILCSSKEQLCRKEGFFLSFSLIVGRQLVRSLSDSLACVVKWREKAAAKRRDFSTRCDFTEGTRCARQARENLYFTNSIFENEETCVIRSRLRKRRNVSNFM